MSQSAHSPKTVFPTVVVLGIVALSVILFFVFTLPFFKNRGSTKSSSRLAETSEVKAPEPGEALTGARQPEESDPLPAAAPVPVLVTERKVYGNAPDLISDLSATVDSGNASAALLIVGKEKVDGQTLARFQTLVAQGRFTTAANEPFVEIGRFNGKIRYALNLHRAASDGLPAENKKILVDVARTDSGKGWLVSAIHIPTFSAQAASAGTPGASPGASPSQGRGATTSGPDAGHSPSAIVVESAAAGPDDPLMLAHKFISAVFEQDFAKAKSLIDNDSITEEKLAGLFIVTEEGGFKRKTENGLIATSAREDAAWVVAQMVNEETGADFGLEIVKAKDGSGDWKIAALNLDRLLQARARMSGADDVTYAPVVKNPKGGDSLVLYFGYDEGGLHERSARQLEIVAGILKGDPDKTIMIAGHADAKGPEGYNQALSDKRAAAVKRGLLNAGVSPSQILTRSFGESQPISPNLRPDGSDNPDGRKRNRRAEVYLNF